MWHCPINFSPHAIYEKLALFRGIYYLIKRKTHYIYRTSYGNSNYEMFIIKFPVDTPICLNALNINVRVYQCV